MTQSTSQTQRTIEQRDRELWLEVRKRAEMLGISAAALLEKDRPRECQW